MNFTHPVLVSTFFFLVIVVTPEHVYIDNLLSDGFSLGVHCRSGDDDLGEQTVPPGGQWGFGFNPNIWETTLFYCGFHWNNGPTHSFDVYDEYVIGSVCHICYWRIETNQACLYTVTNHLHKCYPWVM
ncbi:hypothetical protein MLD38_006895 [Melastoma candidum]|uniref:Uncharacterized protein n=1 Tax=Melastoma candidum TaxID=119954 RepID=A0ACB9RSC7_9MYRT|nr:hypothetical protein MLD38_006895 [Melastoma candidum]